MAFYLSIAVKSLKVTIFCRCWPRLEETDSWSEWSAGERRLDSDSHLIEVLSWPAIKCECSRDSIVLMPVVGAAAPSLA